MKSKTQGISTKVTASTLGGAVAIIALWLIPGEEPMAVVLAFGTILTFGAGFFMPETKSSSPGTP